MLVGPAGDLHSFRMPARVLLAEDNLRQADVLRRYLEAEGHEVITVHDGVEALNQARRSRPDLVILDVMMPGLDGLSACRILRRESAVPVLIVTARAEEDDMLSGLDLGADDYMTKPYRPRELVARVRTLLRRGVQVRAEEEVFYLGGLVVDVPRKQVRLSGRDVECTPAEFEIISAMAAQPERVFSRPQLLRATQAVDRASTNRAIDSHIVNLRRKIEQDPRNPALLLTVYGLGYKLANPTAATDVP